MSKTNTPITIPLSFTFKSIMKSKLFSWRRKSIYVYGLASIMFSFSAPIIIPNLVETSYMRIFLLAFVSLTVTSLALIGISAHLLAKKFSQKRFEIDFLDSEISVRSVDGLKWTFLWTSLGLGKESASVIIIPEKGILCEILRHRVPSRISYLCFEKYRLEKMGLLNPFVQILKMKGVLQN